MADTLNFPAIFEHEIRLTHAPEDLSAGIARFLATMQTAMIAVTERAGTRPTPEIVGGLKAAFMLLSVLCDVLAEFDDVIPEMRALQVEARNRVQQGARELTPEELDVLRAGLYTGNGRAN